jgi:hypothetical protein
MFPLSDICRPSLFNKLSKSLGPPPHRQIPFAPLPRMFIPQRPDDQTHCIHGVVSGEEKVRGETEDGDRDEREKVVLCKGKVEGHIFAKVVFDRV